MDQENRDCDLHSMQDRILFHWVCASLSYSSVTDPHLFSTCLQPPMNMHLGWYFLFFEMGPSVKFVSAIKDAIFNKKWRLFLDFDLCTLPLAMMFVRNSPVSYLATTTITANTFKNSSEVPIVVANIPCMIFIQHLLQVYKKLMKTCLTK